MESSPKYFYCELCQLQFTEKHVFDNHLSALHGKETSSGAKEPFMKQFKPTRNNKSFQCNLCNTVFQSKSAQFMKKRI